MSTSPKNQHERTGEQEPILYFDAQKRTYSYHDGCPYINQSLQKYNSRCKLKKLIYKCINVRIQVHRMVKFTIDFNITTLWSLCKKWRTSAEGCELYNKIMLHFTSVYIKHKLPWLHANLLQKTLNHPLGSYGLMSWWLNVFFGT